MVLRAGIRQLASALAQRGEEPLEAAVRTAAATNIAGASAALSCRVGACSSTCLGLPGACCLTAPCGHCAHMQAAQRMLARPQHAGSTCTLAALQPQQWRRLQPPHGAYSAWSASGLHIGVAPWTSLQHLPGWQHLSSGQEQRLSNLLSVGSVRMVSAQPAERHSCSHRHSDDAHSREHQCQHHHQQSGPYTQAAPQSLQQQQQDQLHAAHGAGPLPSAVPSTPPIASSQATASPIVGVSTLQSGAGFKKTFYKRHLPSPPAIAFASPEGKQLFAEALADGTMAGFFKLVEQFSTQDEPAFCGLTSLSMVLNALSIDPRRIWKGAWRWFHEGMLDCCRPLDMVRRDGITLVQAAVLARCNGARVDIKRHGTFTKEEFRRQVEEICTSGEEHMIVTYSRRTFGQTGDGHFSPVGGYHRGRDLVLILDVARFKYPPHWVSLHTLYEAMSCLDPVTGLPRGYLLMSAHHLLDSAMFTLDVRQEGWQQAQAYAMAMPALLQQQLLSAASQAGLGAGLKAGPATAALQAVAMPVLGVQGAGASVDRHTSASSTASAQAPHPASVTPPPTASVTGSSPSTSAELKPSAGPTLPAAPSAPSPAIVAALRQLLQHLPLDSAMLFAVVREQAVGPAERCLPQGARNALLAELRGLPLYQLVAEVLQGRYSAVAEAAEAAAAPGPANDPTGLSSTGGKSDSGEGFLTERVTLLLLLQPASAWPGADSWGSEDLAAQWHALMDLTGYSIVAAEVAYLRQQFVNVEQVLQSGSVEATCGEPACSHKLDCAAHGHA